MKETIKLTLTLITGRVSVRYPKLRSVPPTAPRGGK